MVLGEMAMVMSSCIPEQTKKKKERFTRVNSKKISNKTKYFILFSNLNHYNIFGKGGSGLWRRICIERKIKSVKFREILSLLFFLNHSRFNGSGQNSKIVKKKKKSNAC
jgi:hypothetical protein